MRDFFKQELQTLKAKTGLNQYENLSAMPDAAFQLKTLFDAIEYVCSQFAYIPDEDKKAIVLEGIITDQEFNQLNARTVYKWLNAKKDRYFKEMAHMPTEPVAEPLKGKEMEDMLKYWESELMGTTNNFNVPELSPDEIKKEGQEEERMLKAKLEGLSKKKVGYIPDPEKWEPRTLEMSYRQQIKNMYGELPEEQVLEILETLKNK